MDGMLSQDEINALLNGMDVSAEADNTDTKDSGGVSVDDSLLTETEQDAIGEIANISMGSSATTLFSLVNRKVDISTPQVALANWETVTEGYERPCVFIQIKYTAGIDGSNVMVLKEHDVMVITDLMMGGDGSNTGGELGELHLSAISEAMNQMMGAAATSMSTMLGKMIDISPPEASHIDLQDFKEGSEIAEFLGGTFVKISFRMQIGDLIDSTIMQLYPIDFAKDLYQTFMSSQMPDTEPVKAPEPEPYVPPTAATEPSQDMTQVNNQAGMTQQGYGMPQMGMTGQGYGMPQMGVPVQGYGMPQMGMPPQGYGVPMGMPGQGYGMPQPNVQTAQFQSFSGGGNTVAGQENIGIIKDVPLEVTVELGRAKKSIAEILDFAPGTIIELDKIAGEPIDVLVNGKFVAKGEVVVIEESFGIRVTEIIK